MIGSLGPDGPRPSVHTPTYGKMHRHDEPVRKPAAHLCSAYVSSSGSSIKNTVAVSGAGPNAPFFFKTHAHTRTHVHMDNTNASKDHRTHALALHAPAPDTHARTHALMDNTGDVVPVSFTQTTY